MIQQSIIFARTERDAAISLVSGNAGAQWNEAAFNLLRIFAASVQEFMTEDARAYALQCGLTKPHDNRAWGAVTVRAIKAGVISKCGYAPSKTGHMRPMPVWKSNITNKGSQQ